MIRIEGIPEVAARLADAEQAKAPQTFNKQPKGHLVPNAFEPAPLRPDSSGQRMRMTLDGSGPWNDVTGLPNLDTLVVKLSDNLGPDHRFEG